MPETAVGPLRLGQLPLLDEFGPGYLAKDHLRESLAALYREIVLTEVYYDKVDKPPVVAVYRSRRIDQGSADWSG